MERYTIEPHDTQYGRFVVKTTKGTTYLDANGYGYTSEKDAANALRGQISHYKAAGAKKAFFTIIRNKSGKWTEFLEDMKRLHSRSPIVGIKNDKDFQYFKNKHNITFQKVLSDNKFVDFYNRWMNRQWIYE